MKIVFLGDSLTEGKPGVPYLDILRQRLEGHELVNYGKGGDTVISLYRRMQKLDLDPPIDIAFVWIGVNDVLVKLSRLFPIYKRLARQPWVGSIDEFGAYYKKILDLLKSRVGHIIAVSPLFIGEDLSNRWNSELAKQMAIIEELARSYPNVTYLDLRPVFIKKFADKKISDFVMKKLSKSFVDIMLKSPEKIDRRAAKKGLQFTLDGVHLNSIGAEIIADVFSRAIVR